MALARSSAACRLLIHAGAGVGPAAVRLCGMLEAGLEQSKLVSK